MGTLRLGGQLQHIVDPTFTPPAEPSGFLGIKPGSKGAMIAGILGDMLAAGSGGQPVYTMNMMADRRRQQDMDASEAIWSRRRQAENDDWTQRQQWQQAHPDPSPMVRDVAAWQAMGPEQRAAFEAMQKAKEGDPIINTTLPNGQFYSGPRSGLAQALTGVAVPARPVGSLTPIDGGPASAPGGFPGR